MANSYSPLEALGLVDPFPPRPIASSVAIYIGPGKRSMGPNTNAIHLCTTRNPLRHPGGPNIDPCNTIFSSESRTPFPQPHTQQEAAVKPIFKDLNSKEKTYGMTSSFLTFGTRRGASRKHPPNFQSTLAREAVAVTVAEGTLDLEHVKKWAARGLLASRKAKWAVLSERAIILLYNQGLHRENVASNSCERSKCEQGQCEWRRVN